MRSFRISIVAILLFAVGCGSESPPVQVTADMEAEQKRLEQEVHDAEVAQRKKQMPAKSFEQRVEEAESNRRRR